MVGCESTSTYFVFYHIEKRTEVATQNARPYRLTDEIGSFCMNIDIFLKSAIIGMKGEKMKDIYKISSDDVIGLIEKYKVRFRVILDKHRDLILGEYKEVPSWLRFQIGMKRAGKGALLEEIEEIDNTFLLDEMQNEVLEALQRDDSERLKALQLATGILVNREKLGGNGNGDDGVGQPMAMTINVSGVKGGKK